MRSLSLLIVFAIAALVLMAAGFAYAGHEQVAMGIWALALYLTAAAAGVAVIGGLFLAFTREG